MAESTLSVADDSAGGFDKSGVMRGCDVARVRDQVRFVSRGREAEQIV